MIAVPNKMEKLERIVPCWAFGAFVTILVRLQVRPISAASFARTSSSTAGGTLDPV